MHGSCCLDPNRGAAVSREEPLDDRDDVLGCAEPLVDHQDARITDERARDQHASVKRRVQVAESQAEGSVEW